MSRALPYTLILAALITSLAFGEVRLVTQPDVSWGPSADNTTSAGGHTGGKLPRYFSSDAFSDNLTVYANDVIAKGPYVDVRAYGAVCDNTTDDSAAVALATTYALATGKPLMFPDNTCYMASQWVISSDNSAKVKPLRIIGQGADMVSTGVYPSPQGGSIIRLGYASGPKILAKGRGAVIFSGVALYNSGTDNQAFIYSEGSVVKADSTVSLWGGPNRNDGFHFGGDTSAQGFQGYGSEVIGVQFHRIIRAVYARTWANALFIERNTIWNDCAGEAAFEYDGKTPNAVTGIYTAGNLVEMVGYSYGWKLTNANNNYFAGNSFFDGANTTWPYYLDSTSTYNTFLEGYISSGTTNFVYEPTLGRNTIIRNAQNQASSLGLTYLNVYNGQGIRFFGAYGPSVYYGDNTSTWRKSELILNSADQRNWQMTITNDNNSSTLVPYEVRSYPDALWSTTTTELYSAYTFRFRSPTTELWGDYIWFRNSGGDNTAAYFYSNDLYMNTAGKGIVLKNAADNVTKRVRLNDAGDGLIFEAP